MFYRVLGATVIVVGLYFVVWGKSKDHYISSTPMINEEPEKQVPNPVRTGKENSNLEVITIDAHVEGSEATMKK